MITRILILLAVASLGARGATVISLSGSASLGGSFSMADQYVASTSSAITLIQSAANSAGPSATQSVTLASTPIQDNYLIACIVADDVTTIDSTGWTVAASASDYQITTIAWKKAGAGESKTLTAHLNGANNACLSLTEWSGIASPPVDKTATNTAQGYLISAGPTAATTLSKELLIAAVGHQTLGGTWLFTSWTNSFLALTNLTVPASPVIGGDFGYRIVSSNSAYTATAVMGGIGNSHGTGAIVTFNGANQ